MSQAKPASTEVADGDEPDDPLPRAPQQVTDRYRGGEKRHRDDRREHDRQPTPSGCRCLKRFGRSAAAHLHLCGHGAAASSGLPNVLGCDLNDGFEQDAGYSGVVFALNRSASMNFWMRGSVAESTFSW